MKTLITITFSILSFVAVAQTDVAKNAPQDSTKTVKVEQFQLEYLQSLYNEKARIEAEISKTYSLITGTPADRIIGYDGKIKPGYWILSLKRNGEK